MAIRGSRITVHDAEAEEDDFETFEDPAQSIGQKICSSDIFWLNEIDLNAFEDVQLISIHAPQFPVMFNRSVIAAVSPVLREIIEDIEIEHDVTLITEFSLNELRALRAFITEGQMPLKWDDELTLSFRAIGLNLLNLDFTKTEVKMPDVLLDDHEDSDDIFDQSNSCLFDDAESEELKVKVDVPEGLFPYDDDNDDLFAQSEVVEMHKPPEGYDPVALEAERNNSEAQFVPIEAMDKEERRNRLVAGVPTVAKDILGGHFANSLGRPKLYEPGQNDIRPKKKRGRPKKTVEEKTEEAESKELLKEEEIKVEPVERAFREKRSGNAPLNIDSGSDSDDVPSYEYKKKRKADDDDSDFEPTKGDIDPDDKALDAENVPKRQRKPHLGPRQKANLLRNIRAGELRKMGLDPDVLLKDVDFRPEPARYRRKPKEQWKRYNFIVETERDTSLKFQCELCNFGHDKEVMLKRHQLRHKYMDHTAETGELDFCIFCEKGFQNATLRRKHESEHKQNDSLQCPTCPKVFMIFDQYRFDLHVRSHTEGRVAGKCACCGRSENHKQDLDSPYHKNQCRHDGCTKTFETWKEHKEHLGTDHKGVWLHICYVCGYKTKWMNLICKHRITVHGINKTKRVVCSICAVAVPASWLKNHEEDKHGQEPTPCERCGKIFNHPNSVMRHLKHCDPDREEKRRARLRARNLLRDLVQPTACDHCGKVFQNPRKLQRHIDSMHTADSEKKFKCEICNKGFINKQHMERHMRTHTGAKPYSCQECGQAFADLSNRNHHYRAVHLGVKRRK